MRLHLGCGENYIEGYTNIDFPPSSHTLQNKTVADLYADITKLKYPHNSLDEIRIHHVFEHFRRPSAAAMIASWNNWLVHEGEVYIEVPDLAEMSKVIISPLSTFSQIAIAERHLFGSHEASWAAHYESYNKQIFSKLLYLFGYKKIRFKRTNWKGTSNLHVYANKDKSLTFNEALTSAEIYLKYFLVDNSVGELRLLDIWLEEFKRNLEISW